MKFWKRKPIRPGRPIYVAYPIYLVRHGQTDWNAEHRMQGLTDIPLNDTGRAQAHRYGEILGDHIGDNIRHMAFVSSYLGRAQETMQILRDTMGLSPHRYGIDDRIAEIDLGDWNGRTVEEVAKDDPEAWKEREADKWSYQIPGGESYAAAAKRARAFLREIDRPTVIVSHGGIGRVLRGFGRNLTIEELLELRSPQDRIFKIKNRAETALR